MTSEDLLFQTVSTVSRELFVSLVAEWSEVFLSHSQNAFSCNSCCGVVSVANRRFHLHGPQRSESFQSHKTSSTLGRRSCHSACRVLSSSHDTKSHDCQSADDLPRRTKDIRQLTCAVCASDSGQLGWFLLFVWCGHLGW